MVVVGMVVAVGEVVVIPEQQEGDVSEGRYDGVDMHLVGRWTADAPGHSGQHCLGCIHLLVNRRTVSNRGWGACLDRNRLAGGQLESRR